MKWKTHIVMVGNKCGTFWKGDTSAFLWVRDILKPRPRVQSVKVPVWDIHTLHVRPSDVITTNNQNFETSIALQKIKTLSQLCEKKSRLQSRPGQEKCFEIQLLSGSVCFSLQLPPIKYTCSISVQCSCLYQLTRLLRLISLAHLTTKLPFSLSQEQNLLALGNWTHGFWGIIICHPYISHSLCVNVRRV